MNFPELKSKIRSFGKGTFKIIYRKRRKEPWQIAAARYCVENSEKGFNTDEFKKHIQSIYSVSDGHVSQFIEEELQMPPGSKFSRNARGGFWIPPLELVSKVTDYDELKEARKNSKQAFWLSVIAIIISSAALYVTTKLGENQIEASQEQVRLQNAIWDYERMRNDRVEQRDIDWRREDLRTEGRLP